MRFRWRVEPAHMANYLRYVFEWHRWETKHVRLETHLARIDRSTDLFKISENSQTDHSMMTWIIRWLCRFGKAKSI